jgi:endonuclease/exonuclease/phosphatase family metal-dependent hydrolase
MNRFFVILILFFFATEIWSQSRAILLDGEFRDWESTFVFKDASGDGTKIDILELALTNDKANLYLRIKTVQELELTNGNKLVLYLDTDNNSQTGTSFNGLGAELLINLGEKKAQFISGSTNYQLGLNNLRFLSLPTVSSTEFEIALRRDIKPNGQQLLFTGKTIRVALKDQSQTTGDALPNAGIFLSYTFDETPTEVFKPISLEKTDNRHIRLMTYNVLEDGIDDLKRSDHFGRIIRAINPDIVTFNECWNTNPAVVATFMNGILPLPNFQNWNTVKIDAGNITASRFPILQNWEIRPVSRQTASLIDLPSTYATDLLVVNAHFRCCTDNASRQLEADAFVNFILDAKAPGGKVTLPVKTPFVLSGDLNLVELRQQLTTILTGQTVNKSIYGPGGAMDWDGSNIQDIISTHTDQPVAYTWRNYTSEFSPSRIDYHIFSSSAMTVAKSFILDTEPMTSERLALYKLEKSDAQVASDHLPKVTDFIIPLVQTPASDLDSDNQFLVFPIPFYESVNIQFKGSNHTSSIELLDWTGGVLKELTVPTESGEVNITLQTAEYPSGIYYLVIRNGSALYQKKLVKQ